jgi:hypothetical protein
VIEMLSSLIDNIKSFGLERVFGRYYSIYRAEVTSNLDEEFRGRIKAKVPSLFGDTELPNWINPRDLRASGFNKGEFYPPELGSWVFVEFEGGDTNYPVYSGGWHGDLDEGDNTGPELPKDFAYDEDGSPKKRGYRDPSGNRIVFDATKDKQKLILAASDGVKDTPREHTLEFSLEKDKELLKIASLAHFFVMDDTKDKEGVYLIHKTGTQFQIDAKGSMKIFTKSGHLLSMNEEDSTVLLNSKDGSTIAVKDNIVIADASGKSTVNISKDTVQITTAKDLVMQSNSATLKSGSISLDGGNAKMTLGSAKIAMGTAACEIVDTLIKIIDAFLNDPALVGTGTGPSTGLIGKAKVELTLIKVKLNLIKGSL